MSLAVYLAGLSEGDVFGGFYRVYLPLFLVGWTCFVEGCVRCLPSTTVHTVEGLGLAVFVDLSPLQAAEEVGA